MKFSHLPLFLLTLVAVATPALAQDQEQVAGSTILVQIGDFIITDYNLAKASERVSYMRPEVDERDISALAMRELVHRALFISAAGAMELPLDMIDHTTKVHIEGEIQRYGSHDLFIEAKFGELYIDNLADYHDFVYHDLVRSQVLSIVTGRAPTSNNSKRIIVEPSPSEIRRAYIENEKYRQTEAVIKWDILRFFPSRGQQGDAADRATQAISDFEAGKISLIEFQKLANSRRSFSFDQGNLSQKITDFVTNASVNDTLLLHSAASTVSQVILVTENSPAVDADFNTAQLLIRKDLMNEARSKAIEEFIAQTASEVDIWATDEYPGVKDLISIIVGRNIPANNPAEL
ncbi:MAG: hypothetical protein H8E25_05030 [Planctomycetes bacterium]|nr:hypothetical protein [Planctomycetota bacterium]